MHTVGSFQFPNGKKMDTKFLNNLMYYWMEQAVEQAV